MKLEVKEIAKEVFKDKELFIEELPESKVRIWYKAPHVTNLKPVILPKKIDIDEEFVEGLGLYIADGKTTPNDKRHIEFTSIDSDIAKFMLDFFIHRLNVSYEDIYIRIRHSNGNENELKEKWSKVLNVSMDKIVVKRYGKNKTDCSNIHINSRLLKSIFGKIMQISLNKIPRSIELSRAFLRGHFAADGGIETRRNKNFVQIQHVIFAYHKTNEAWLRDYIIKLLELNGITNVKIRESENKETACIRITLWKNFEKIWKVNLFERSIRKKCVFINSIKNSSIYLKLQEGFHNEMFSSLNMTQQEIARLISCKSEGETCDTIHGKHLLRLEQIGKVIEKTNFDWKDVINNCMKIRMGQRGYFNLDIDFINFVLNERRLV